MTRSLACAVATFALTFASLAMASESTVMIRLDYVAAKTCPDAANNTGSACLLSSLSSMTFAGAGVTTSAPVIAPNPR